MKKSISEYEFQIGTKNVEGIRHIAIFLISYSEWVV